MKDLIIPVLAALGMAAITFLLLGVSATEVVALGRRVTVSYPRRVE